MPKFTNIKKTPTTAHKTRIFIDIILLLQNNYYMDSMTVLPLSKFTAITFLSSPETANACRKELEDMLIYHKKVEIDFSDVHVTQGFLTCLFDPLIEKRGLKIFSRLFFANLSDNSEQCIQQIIKNHQKNSVVDA